MQTSVAGEEFGVKTSVVWATVMNLPVPVPFCEVLADDIVLFIVIKESVVVPNSAVANAYRALLYVSNLRCVLWLGLVYTLLVHGASALNCYLLKKKV